MKRAGIITVFTAVALLAGIFPVLQPAAAKLTYVTIGTGGVTGVYYPTERAIHLAFAMGMVFLLRPLLRRERKRFRLLGVTDGIPVNDYILAALGALTALSLALDYEGIAMRAGRPLARDIISGTLLVIPLLEAARQIIGPALSILGP